MEGLCYVELDGLMVSGHECEAVVQSKSFCIGVTLNIEIHGDAAVGVAEQLLSDLKVDLVGLENSCDGPPKGVPANLLADDSGPLSSWPDWRTKAESSQYGDRPPVSGDASSQS